MAASAPVHATVTVGGVPYTSSGTNQASAQANAQAFASKQTGQSTTASTKVPSPTTTGTTAPGAPATTPATTQAPAVFSANKAATFVNNTMLPAMNNGLQGIAAQNAAKAQNDTLQPLPGETPEQYKARTAAVANSNQPSQPTPPPQPTAQDIAAKQIAETPDAGNEFIYDPTGQRLEVPLGAALPAGYSKTPPANPVQRGHSIVNQFNAADGTTYQQYTDGTYGVANADGTFAATVSSDQFNKAFDTSPTNVLNSIAKGIASLKNGALPLTPPQQAQIDALNQNLATAVAAQQKANEAYTGATTVAMNLYGMGDALPGLGIIKDTVDQGIQKIATLQTQAADAIAKMEESFNKDNLDQAYQYYTAYSNAVKEINDNITQMHTFAFQQKEHADQEADNLRQFNETVQQDAIKNHQWDVTNAREERLAESTIATQAVQRQQMRVDMEKTAEEIKQLKQQDTYTAGLPGGVQTDANGRPIASQQQTFLANVAKSNPGLANTIKAIANYQVSLPASFLRSKQGLQVLGMVEEYDPTFDQAQYATRAAMQKNVTSEHAHPALKRPQNLRFASRKQPYPGTERSQERPCRLLRRLNPEQREPDPRRHRDRGGEGLQGGLPDRSGDQRLEEGNQRQLKPLPDQRLREHGHAAHGRETRHHRVRLRHRDGQHRRLPDCHRQERDGPQEPRLRPRRD
jgi:hypothetical protein